MGTGQSEWMMSLTGVVREDGRVTYRLIRRPQQSVQPRRGGNGRVLPRWARRCLGGDGQNDLAALDYLLELDRQLRQWSDLQERLQAEPGPEDRGFSVDGLVYLLALDRRMRARDRRERAPTGPDELPDLEDRGIVIDGLDIAECEVLWVDLVQRLWRTRDAIAAWIAAWLAIVESWCEPTSLPGAQMESAAMESAAMEPPPLVSQLVDDLDVAPCAPPAGDVVVTLLAA